MNDVLSEFICEFFLYIKQPSIQTVMIIQAKTIMKLSSFILFASIAFVPGLAMAKSLPTLNYQCPGNIAVHTEPGHVYFNGKPAKIIRTVNSDEGLYVEAHSGKTTVSISVDATDESSVSYTGPGRANGVCQLENDGE